MPSATHIGIDGLGIRTPTARVPITLMERLRALVWGQTHAELVGDTGQ